MPNSCHCHLELLSSALVRGNDVITAKFMCFVLWAWTDIKDVKSRANNAAWNGETGSFALAASYLYCPTSSFFLRSIIATTTSSYLQCFFFCALLHPFDHDDFDDNAIWFVSFLPSLWLCCFHGFGCHAKASFKAATYGQSTRVCSDSGSRWRCEFLVMRLILWLAM